MRRLLALPLALAVSIAAAQEPTPPPPAGLPRAPADRPHPPADQLERQDETMGSEAAAIMDRALPFRDGQILHYQDAQGNPDGFAVRHLLTIRFYDADGRFLGRAVRVSESATRYFDANGIYLGRRLHRQLVR